MTFKQLQHSKILKLSAASGLALLLAGAASAQTPGAPKQEPSKGPGEVIADLYDLVSSAGGMSPDWDKVRACFIKEAVVVLRTTWKATTVFSLDGFIQDFIDFYEKPFRRGALTLYPNKEGFTEKVVKTKVWEFWDMAHVLVLYEAHITNDPTPPQRGVDSWLLSRREGRWLIVAVTNDLVTKDHPVPSELRGEK
jgi:hypothetical protein